MNVPGTFDDGRLFAARAELDPGMADRYIVRSNAAVPVLSSAPLHVACAVSEATMDPDGAVTYVITARRIPVRSI